MVPELSAAAVLEADLTWTGAAFEPGIRLAVDAGGRIRAVGRLDEGPTRRLTGRALLPGFVDVHSHAFQRGLRGRGERFSDAAGTFWTWREEMYALVESLEPDAFRSLCRRTFEEMRDAGITTVGEFHYLHQGAKSSTGSFDEILLDAAAEAGIRLVLLQSYYRTGGIGRPLEPAQRRFDLGSVNDYWDRFDRLAERLDPDLQSLGVAPHSIRAVGIDAIAALHAEARRRGLPFHMHVEEQRAEVEACLDAYGEPPMRVLLRALSSTHGAVAVHCTHTRSEDLDAFVRAGGAVCVCPLTEANLGDGLPDLLGRANLPERLCLGTDSNLRISLTEEMRWLEYGQRLRHERRGILRDADGRVGRALLAIATANGARALAVEAGAIEPGRWADFTLLDLSAPSLAGCDPETLLDAWVFGSDERAISGTFVAGRWRATGG